MTKSILLMIVFLPLVSVALAADYAIVVSRETHDDPQWKPVIDALSTKYSDSTTIVWEQQVSQALDSLRSEHPRYTCFVAKFSEAGRAFVGEVHRLTRKLDTDPYTDTVWGILTGYDAANALRIARHAEPLVVRKVASGTEVALEMCTQGIWYDELVQNKSVSRTAAGKLQRLRGPDDTTRALADTLTDYGADLFVTSGHATERDWQIGFRYHNGQFRSEAGKMFGMTTDKERFEIQSSNPKVYLPIGNCLMGHIDGPDSMALAWMNSLAVNQMIGYTVVTWYGYGGWGVLDYFLEQPGRYTFAEAFHANHHALIHRLATNFDGLAAVEFEVGSRNVPAANPNPTGKAAGLTATDSRGLLWDRDTVAFYGDPAWVARMEAKTNAFDQSLLVNGDRYTLTITPNRGVESFQPINTNGSQRGWRPIVQLLPHRVRDVQVVSGDQWNPVVTDDFILVPNPRTCDPTTEYQVVFTARPVN